MRLEIPKKYKSFKDYCAVTRVENLLFDYDASFGDYIYRLDNQRRIDEMLEYIDSINQTIYAQTTVPSSYYVVSQPVANYFTTAATSAY